MPEIRKATFALFAELFILWFICFATAHAQSSASSGATLSWNTVKEVLPDSPPERKGYGEPVEVTIRFTIGDQGKVSLTESPDYKSSINNACEQAARQWLFRPEIPAGTTGVLKFRFTPDGKVSATLFFHLKHTREDPIPEALFKITGEEMKWWQELRAAGHEVVKVNDQRDAALRVLADKISKEVEREMKASAGRATESEIYDTVSRRFDPDYKALHARFDPQVSVAEGKFRSLLQTGKQKSWRVPLPNHRLLIVHKVKAKYTEEARQFRLQGVVVLRADFHPDGTIGGIRVVRSLPGGLTEQAVEALKQMIFIPESRDGRFLTSRISLEFSFNLY